MSRHHSRLLPWGVMLLLSSLEDRIPLTRIRDRLSAVFVFDDAQLYRAVQRLAGYGYVKKEPHPDSRRECVIGLTALGAEACELFHGLLAPAVTLKLENWVSASSGRRAGVLSSVSVAGRPQ